jgi:hypothetical protein
MAHELELRYDLMGALADVPPSPQRVVLRQSLNESARDR